jgi:hypothetical protein
MTRLSIAAALCLLSLALCGATASAQTSYAGVWQAGPSRIAVTLHSWGDDCGPRPQSTTQPGGGTVEITEFGHNLAVHATDRTILSNACWSQNRAITRVSSSFLDGVWTTKCRTPPNDPKSEEGEYVLKVENNGTLQYRDSSNYNWELRTSNCVASIVTTQTLTRSVGTPATAARTKTKAPEIEEPDAPEPQNCTPGVAIKLVVRPKRIQIEPGQRTCLRAVALDAAGCPVPGTDVRWTLQHSPALRGTQNAGCFEAASSAAEAEGTFKLIAVASQASGLRAEGVVEVSTVDFSDLMARRIETGAVSGHPIAQAGAAESQTAARVQARNESTGPGIAPLLVIGAGALLAIVGLLWWWRKRSTTPAIVAAASVDSMSVPPPRASPPRPAAAINTPLASIPAAPPAIPAAPPPTDTSETWICPACRRGYPKGHASCPCIPGGTELVPYQEFAKRGREAPAQDRKLCPDCGNKCPNAAAFCGACGKRF